MTSLWLFATLLTVSPGLADPGAAEAAPVVDIQGWDAARYNDHLVNVEYLAVKQLEASFQLALSAQSREAFDAWLVQARARVGETRARMISFPPFEGDPSLRDAILEGWHWLARMLDEVIPQMWATIDKEPPTNADLVALEGLARELEERGQALDANLRQVQRVFADSHRLILREVYEAPSFEAPRPFEAPGLPPEGSRLSADVHVALAIGYQNGLLATQNGMMDVFNAFMEATNGDPADLEASRQQILARIQAHLRTARAYEDWQSDASLAEALVSFGEVLETELGAPSAEYTELMTKKRLKKSDVERINALVEEGARSVEAALDAFGVALDAFQDRWRIKAYEAWKQSLGAPQE